MAGEGAQLRVLGDLDAASAYCRTDSLKVHLYSTYQSINQWYGQLLFYLMLSHMSVMDLRSESLQSSKASKQTHTDDG